MAVLFIDQALNNRKSTAARNLRTANLAYFDTAKQDRRIICQRAIGRGPECNLQAIRPRLDERRNIRAAELLRRRADLIIP